MTQSSMNFQYIHDIIIVYPCSVDEGESQCNLLMLNHKQNMSYDSVLSSSIEIAASAIIQDLDRNISYCVKLL